MDYRSSRNGYSSRSYDRSRFFNRTNAFLAIAGAGLLAAAVMFSPIGGGTAAAPDGGSGKPDDGGSSSQSTSAKKDATKAPSATPTPRGTNPREGAAEPPPEGFAA